MRRVVTVGVFMLLFVATPAVAAGLDGPLPTTFPRISKYQVRAAPVGRIATQDHDACGSNPSIPPNCIYLCNNGVPMHNPDGSPTLVCWYSPDPGGGGNICNRYYDCNNVYNGCEYSGNWEEACYFTSEYGQPMCSACSPY